MDPNSNLVEGLTETEQLVYDEGDLEPLAFYLKRRSETRVTPPHVRIAPGRKRKARSTAQTSRRLVLSALKNHLRVCN